MKASLILGFVGVQLVAAGFDDFKFYSKCSASSSTALWSYALAPQLRPRQIQS